VAVLKFQIMYIIVDVHCMNHGNNSNTKDGSGMKYIFSSISNKGLVLESMNDQAKTSMCKEIIQSIPLSQLAYSSKVSTTSLQMTRSVQRTKSAKKNVTSTCTQ
jgi:hypothetical protein